MKEANTIRASKKNATAYAWTVIFFSAAFLFYKYTLQISPAVMSAELMKDHALTATGLGFLAGVYFFTYLLMQIPSGILLDRYGVRRFTTLAIFLCALGALLFSQAHSFLLACIARLFIGFGAAFATTSYMKLASACFPASYSALLSGLFGTACMTGAGTAGLPLAWLISKIDWRQTILLCSLIGFGLTIAFWLVLKRKESEFFASQSQSEPFNGKALLHLFRKKSNWALILYSGLAFTPISVFGGLWGVPYIMAAYPVPKDTAAFLVSLTFFGFAFGGMVMGWIGKQLQNKLPMMKGGAACTLFFFIVLLYIPSLPYWALSVVIFSFGFSASSFVMAYTIAKNINSQALVATVVGVINIGDPFCGALADPLIGKILDLHFEGHSINQVKFFSVHAYQLGLSVLTFYLLLAILCCYFINENEG